MLYDHETDGDENENIAEQPVNSDTVRALLRQLESEMGEPIRP